MGVGMPAELPEYVARGIDMMDCVLPSRNARNGYLFTSEGRVIIKHARYKDDERPARSATARATLVRSYSRAYLRHLFQSGEILYSVLATRHNIQRYLDIMREIRHAIISDSFPEYLRCVRSALLLRPSSPLYWFTTWFSICFCKRRRPTPIAGIPSHPSHLRDLLFSSVSPDAAPAQTDAENAVRACRTDRRCVTSGGIVGTIVAIDSDTLVLRVKPDNVKIQVARSAVSSLVSTAK